MTGVDQEAAQLAAERSAAESSRVAQEEAVRLAAEEAARVEAERVAAQQAAAEQAAAEQAAAEQAAAEQAAADQAAAERAEAEEAERRAAQEQAQFDAAVETGSCTEAPADRVDECTGLVEDRGAEAAAESGWFDSRGWVSPETAKRALAAGIPPGGDVPGYLRCGTICGEDPTSGEVQAWNLGIEPVPPGYESWLAPYATPYTGEGQ